MMMMMMMMMMITTLAKTAFLATSLTLRRPPLASPQSQSQSHSTHFHSSRPKSSLVVGMSSSSSSNAASTADKAGGLGIDYPELVVFDLDACLWDKEMYEMPAIPSPEKVVRGDLNGRGQGVTGVYSGSREIISLHKGSLVALQEHADHQLYLGMKIALASSADTPFAEKIGRAALKILEVVPGMTIWDLLMRDWNGQDVNQIGRQPPLSSNKARSHFPQIRKLTGIRYDKMLFFDDCNWGDHVGMVASACREEDNGKGVAGYRTPNGLGVADWRKGIEHYADLQKQQ